MENYDLIINLATILLIPLLPAFVIYKFLPSETLVNGPFKGLNINLTGAFGGYFLLVMICVGLSNFIFKNQQTDHLKISRMTIDSLNRQIQGLNSIISQEKNKYERWEMIGQLDSKSPERTKIFVNEENISINALGRFRVNLVVRNDDNHKMKLPNAVCFFNQAEGYNVIDLSQKHNATIDTTNNEINIKNKIKLSLY